MTTAAGSLAPVDDDDPFATLAGGVDVVHVDSFVASSTSTTEAQPTDTPAQEEEEEEEDEEDDSDSDDVSTGYP